MAQLPLKYIVSEYFTNNGYTHVYVTGPERGSKIVSISFLSNKEKKRFKKEMSINNFVMLSKDRMGAFTKQPHTDCMYYCNVTTKKF